MEAELVSVNVLVLETTSPVWLYRQSKTLFNPPFSSQVNVTVVPLVELITLGNTNTLPFGDTGNSDGK